MLAEMRRRLHAGELTADQATFVRQRLGMPEPEVDTSAVKPVDLTTPQDLGDASSEQAGRRPKMSDGGGGRR